MQKLPNWLLWLLGAGLVLTVLFFAGGWIAMRLTQPQMFEEPVIDTAAPTLPGDLDHGAVLVFSKTSGGFRHGWSIDAANQMIADMAQRNGWQVYSTENAAVFDDDLLPRFAVVVWNNATGAALSGQQRGSFRRWLENGGGYVGLHAAGDGSHADWEWYTYQVIKASYNQHTLVPHTPEALVVAEDREHPASAALPESWRTVEEWYAFNENPREAGARVLVTVDETTYPAGAASMGADHPMVWSHELQSGRVFYSAFGHNEEAYTDARLVPMIEAAIRWAGRLSP